MSGRRLAAFVLGAVALAACARRLPPTVTPTDVAWAQERWPEVTHADLEQGRKLLLSKCGGACHRPPHPAEQPPEAWPEHVAEMAERSGLTPKTRVLLEQYLVTVAVRSASGTTGAAR